MTTDTNFIISLWIWIKGHFWPILRVIYISILLAFSIRHLFLIGLLSLLLYTGLKY